MHPAFSVIFFTTASGAGFGLLGWMAWFAMTGAYAGRTSWGAGLVVGAIFAVVGLLSSLAHLGRPMRSWRAFSQWRSSWLSREGLLATACLLVALWLGLMVWQLPTDPYYKWSVPVPTGIFAGALLLVLSVATVACTAMIYASLKPIPAWRHPLVVPVYLAFSAYTGLLLMAVVFGHAGGRVPWYILAGAATVLLLKLRAWHYVDHSLAPVSRNSALGLFHARPVHVFERPHTEANYLLKEMGYVLARKHARKLRLLAVLCFAVVPALVAVVLLMLDPVVHGGTFLLSLALSSALAGTLVERWLFFAEARHLVTLYY
jgi:DMSO reductase anchor subunit